MAGSTIEAKLRIAAEVAQAITALKQVRAELLSTGKAASSAGQQTQASGAAGADEAVKQTQRRTQAERQALAETKRIEKERLAAQRQAQREAAAQAAAAAAAERKRQREEADRARREKAALDAAAAKAERRKGYQAAALQPQITDIVTGLATGQNPITVALQQGGQLRDLYGGVRPALAAVLSLLTPTVVVVGAVAAGFAAVAVNIAAGYRESDRLNKSLALTGNVAGTTLGQISEVATSLARSTGQSIGSVRDTLEALVATGQETSGTLAVTARAVTAYRKLTGAGAEEAVKEFAGQRDAILEWSTKANKAYNFLSAAQLDYIRTLQSQGRNDEAVRFANEQLAASLEQRTIPAVGALERGWQGVKNAVGGVLDRIKGWGRDKTIEEEIARLREQVAGINKLRENVARGGGTVTSGDTPAERQLAEALRQQAADQVRAAEREAALKDEQDKEYKQTKQFTDAQANLQIASQQVVLARKLAALEEYSARRQAFFDRERAKVEQDAAAEIESEVEKNLRLAALDGQREEQQALADRQRLQAQQAALQAQRAIESRRKTERPEDEFARAAAVAQLDAQIAQLDGQIEVARLQAERAVQNATAQAQRILAADATRQARDWEQAWKDAAQRVRAFAQENAANAVADQADPVARMNAAADAAVADARRELRAQQQALRLQRDLTLDPGQAAELTRQLDQLTQQADRAIAERERKARFDSLAEQSAERLNALNLERSRIEGLLANGVIGEGEAEDRRRAAVAAYVKEVEKLNALQALQARTTPERQAVKQTAQDIERMKGEMTEAERTLRSAGVNGFATFFSDIVTRSKTAGEAVKDFARSVAQTMLNLIARRLGEQLLKALWPAGTGDFLGSIFGGPTTTTSASVRHAGGVIGGLGSAARMVSPLVFAGAQVLHSGGLVTAAGMGLRANEVPVIAEQGEEMLRADNPRHIKNYRPGPAIGNLNINVNLGGDNTVSTDDARQFAGGLKAVVADYVAEQMRPGGLLQGVKRG